MGQDIRTEVIQMLADMTGLEPEETKPEMNIVTDLGADSLKILELAIAIEQKYKVRVTESQMRSISTVGETIDIVEKLIKNKKKNG